MSGIPIPSFLQNRSTNDIHKKMRTIIPADIDMSEGGHAWNMTRPTALIASEICEYILTEVISLIFPQWSYGEYLDHHATERGMTRRQATAAAGMLTITGRAGYPVPAGSTFSTASISGEESIVYVTTEDAEIPATGTINIQAQCTQTGIIGNAPAGTIIMVTGMSRVDSVINEEPFTGGTEEETDESLIQRILEYDRSQGDNFVGSISDYKRWAKSIDGVGNATVIPAQDTSGLVTIVLTDTNGAPATEQLCAAVYNFIMSPEAPEERLAPINALLSVEPPATMEICVRATVELTDNATIESVTEAFAAALSSYLPLAMDDGEIKYTRVAAALAATDGANDFTGLEFGLKDGDEVTYGTENIPITSAQLPSINTDDIFLTEGTV